MKSNATIYILYHLSVDGVLSLLYLSPPLSFWITTIFVLLLYKYPGAAAASQLKKLALC